MPSLTTRASSHHLVVETELEFHNRLHGGLSRYGLVLPSVDMYRWLERLGHTPGSSPTRMLRC